MQVSVIAIILFTFSVALFVGSVILWWTKKGSTDVEIVTYVAIGFSMFLFSEGVAFQISPTILAFRITI